ncbi:DNA cytosine methyltransferase [Heliomicrobium undosum]|uniref:DNA cytosine methyltransferase n=1 Tax=Heliomicrobium undosum TaxID=121734 RepID=UPI001A9AF95D
MGFHTAGYEIVGSVELDPLAAKSHAGNFFRNAPKSVREVHATPRDITTIGPGELLKEFGFENPLTAVDVIIGGPPCQAFARVGRAKLREVREHPEAYLQDERSNLYLRFLHYVRKLQPLAILMENVPDSLNFGGHNIPEETCEVLGEMGYTCRYTLLNASFYGVPQMRERMFLIGYARELECGVSFPEPTHWITLPKGYEGTRRVALRSLASKKNNQYDSVEEAFFPENPPTDQMFFLETPRSSEDLPPAVTAREAIGDLPRITRHLTGEIKRGVKRFTEALSCPRPETSSGYADMMRSWPRFENKGVIYDHVIRIVPRDYPIFRRMNPGDQYPEAYRHALDILQEKIAELSADGITVEPEGPEYEKIKKSIVPPYDPGKFPNKWRKMEADKPSRTLMAHLGKDGYSHIHYDSDQARMISVREAARLQSFPDGFVFEGSMNHAFRQIGNAVPPLMSLVLARHMLLSMGLTADEEQNGGTTDFYELFRTTAAV